MDRLSHNPLVARRTFLGASSVALAAALALGPQTALAAPTAAEKQAEAQSALASLNAMQETLDKASADYYTALDDQQAARDRMDEAQARIDDASSQIADLQGQLGSRARSMYRTGSSSFLDFLLGAASFQEFTNNWSLLTRMNESDADLVQQTKDLRSEVESEKATYAEQEQVAADKASEARAIKENAESTMSSMQATYDSLSAEAQRLVEEERAAQEAADHALWHPTANGGGAGEGSSGGSTPDGPTAPLTPDSPSAPDDDAPSSGGGGGSEPPYSAVTGNAVVDRAYSYIGNAEYVWGACAPGEFDCSGFVSYCLTGAYSRLGTTYTFMDWPQVSDPQPGDVATSTTHCGIYIGGGQMVHASTYGVGVIQGPVQSNMIIVRMP